MGNVRRKAASLIVVAALALIVNLGVGIKSGIGRPMTSDAHYYLQLAGSLAGGHGYVLRDGFWPRTPTMTRSPGWPFVVSLAVRLCPHIAPDAVMRTLCLGLNAAVAVLLVLLVWRLVSNPWVGVVAGMAYTFHPTGLYLANEGASEILFLVLAVAGTLAIMNGGWRCWVGIALLGSSALVRANFVIWVFFAALLTVTRAVLSRRRIAPLWMARCLLATVLFLIPSTLWACRNYGICGHFPVLSTLRGQTFYGGNNDVVANDLEYWGYWVFPNSIPGETTMLALAASLSEYQVDCYYFTKGKDYARKNWFAMPRLLLGKAIRAYVPVPWKPGLGAYVVSAFRWVVFLSALIGIYLLWRRLNTGCLIIVGAMAMTNLFTVLMFWGCARFSFALEPFLLLFSACAVCYGVAYACGGRAARNDHELNGVQHGFHRHS